MSTTSQQPQQHLQQLQQTPQPPRQLKIEWPWPVIASVLGLVILGIAYSLADAYYKSFLRKFWVEADAFPIDKSKHLVLSVWGALNASVNVQTWLSANKMLLVKLVIFILVYIAAWVFIEKGLLWAGSKVGKKKGGTGRSTRFGPIAKRYLLIAAWTLFGIGNVTILGIYIPVLISIPSGIGEAVGKSVADDMKEDFDKGCGKSIERCQALFKDGKEVARGYVIVQSPSRIAVYLNGNVRQLATDGIELRTIDRSESNEEKVAPH
ncbi:hypothetical protein [Burkholderia cepacia]|uniref:hypothetical protein n=1 Tax=Burkholderia cepacia TaxID=292 RepID=UPI002018F3A1|nr:hypothetical protein [Burkholderia cepacia]UQO35500.1 hypothetical protein L0Z22_07115 [Burkholderia cepacia]UQO45812.1 hypothetical protein L0Z05_08915 [Burkholderia cepacia]UQP10896.1 hypothetical protein L0Z01_22665 [Burkholderia cepacia]